VTLHGGVNDVFIFQIAKGITQATGAQIILTGGVPASNIFWQASESVSIGTGAHFEGILLAKTGIAVEANASINGRLLAQTAVTLIKNTVVVASLGNEIETDETVLVEPPADETVLVEPPADETVLVEPPADEKELIVAEPVTNNTPVTSNLTDEQEDSSTEVPSINESDIPIIVNSDSPTSSVENPTSSDEQNPSVENVNPTPKESSSSPVLPLCPTNSSEVNVSCSFEKRNLTDIVIAENISVFHAIFDGTVENHGSISDSTFTSEAKLTGGILSGDITNEGVLADFEFVGGSITGGTLAGQVENNSEMGGFFKDVSLAANTHITGGQLKGTIKGNADQPSRLESLTVSSGSSLEHVIIGADVEIAADVIYGDGVQFEEIEQSNSSDLETTEPPLVNLGYATAINASGEFVANQTTFAGYTSVNADNSIDILGSINVDSNDIGKLADVLVVIYSADQSQYYMLDLDAETIIWDGDISSLVPFTQEVSLDSVQEVRISSLSLEISLDSVQKVRASSLSLNISGMLNIYFGYRLEDGTIVYNLNPLVVGAESPAPIDLGTSGNYAILTKTGVSSVPPSVITGNIGVSPIAAIGITGFSLTVDSTNEFSVSSQVTGKLYAASYTSPTPSILTTAISDMETAYTDAAGRTPDYIELHTGDISGQTLQPGIYKWSTSVLINSDVTLYGGVNDVFIFQIAKGIAQANGTQIILTGGVPAKNIFWQASESVSIGTDAHFEGILLAKTSIAVGANASINGRLLAQTAATLIKDTVVAP